MQQSELSCNTARPCVLAIAKEALGDSQLSCGLLPKNEAGQIDLTQLTGLVRQEEVSGSSTDNQKAEVFRWSLCGTWTAVCNHVAAACAQGLLTSSASDDRNECPTTPFAFKAYTYLLFFDKFINGVNLWYVTPQLVFCHRLLHHKLSIKVGLGAYATPRRERLIQQLSTLPHKALIDSMPPLVKKRGNLKTRVDAHKLTAPFVTKLLQTTQEIAARTPHAGS